MLIVKLVRGLQLSISKQRFLHGNLQEESYMNTPEGMNTKKNVCLKLKWNIYGLVQSAREFYKRLIGVPKGVGFVENKSDPCLLCKRDDDGIALILLKIMLMIVLSLVMKLNYQVDC
jgi:Reverse transcriptase (RNA-dependent DNA polymerase)